MGPHGICHHSAFGGVLSWFGTIRGRITSPGRGVHPTLAGDATPRRCGSDVARWVHVGGPETGWGPCSCLTYLSTYYVAT